MDDKPRVLPPGRDLRWLAALAGLLMLPNLWLGPGITDSTNYNHVWVSQISEGLARGELYPRWLPRSFEGLGSPAFYFYPPLAYHLAAWIDLAGLTALQAVNVAMLLLTLASGVAMHAWLRAKGGRALLGAALYMAAPYHLLDAYVRGALAEHAAFVWLPLLALGIHMLPGRRGVALLALSYAGLLMTHLPVAVLATAFLILPAALLRLGQDRAALLPGLAAGLLGLGLAGAYLLPALTLQPHISSELLWQEGYRPGDWSLGHYLETGEWVALLPFIALAATAIAAAGAARSPAARPWAAIAALSCLAALNLVPFLWSIPLLAKAQFPWRLLCIVEFAAVTSFALAAPGPRLRRLAIVAFAPLFGLTALHAGGRLAQAASLPGYEAGLEGLMRDASEYLPSGFPVGGIEERRSNADLAFARHLPPATVIHVSEAGPVTLRLAAFPIWRVLRDGKEVPTRGPLLTFDAEPGTYRVLRVALWQERAGGALSLLAAVLLALVALPTGAARPTGAAEPRGSRKAPSPEA